MSLDRRLVARGPRPGPRADGRSGRRTGQRQMARLLLVRLTGQRQAALCVRPAAIPRLATVRSIRRRRPARRTRRGRPCGRDGGGSELEGIDGAGLDSTDISIAPASAGSSDTAAATIPTTSTPTANPTTATPAVTARTRLGIWKVESPSGHAWERGTKFTQVRTAVWVELRVGLSALGDWAHPEGDVLGRA